MSDSKFASVLRKINWYPPFLGMGIKVRSFRDDFSRFEVELRNRWYNRNLFGTHFGGSMFAMTDPFFVFILATNLGDDYIVWDKAASIQFLIPAKGTILAVFELTQAEIADIKQQVDELGKKTFHFEVLLHDEQQQVVARVQKEVYVRAKSRTRIKS